MTLGAGMPSGEAKLLKSSTSTEYKSSNVCGYTLFSVFFLYHKHYVANYSTISEWLINYSGGFTKRGLIGQICIWFAENLNFSRF